MGFNKIIDLFKCNNKKEDIVTADHTSLLTSDEYKQLKIFNKIDDFNRVYEKFKKQNDKFTKNEALWSIYNDLRLKYEYEKDVKFLGIVCERQTEILINDKKYQQALETYLCVLYCYLFHYEYSTKEINIIDRHFNNKRKEQLIKLMDKTSYSKNRLEEEFNSIILDSFPNLYSAERANYIIKNIAKRI